LLDDPQYLKGIKKLKAQFDHASKIEAGANAVESILTMGKVNSSLQRGIKDLV
jgi:hypothetical protein